MVENVVGGAAAGGDSANAGGQQQQQGAQHTSTEQQQAFVVPKEISDWAVGKGFKDFETKAKADPDLYKLATSYRETEKFIGGDKIPLPKDMNDKAAMRQVFEKLGAPKTADEYKISQSTAGNHDPAFSNWAKTQFHAANLTQGQAEILNQGWNGYIEGLLKQDTVATQERAAADVIGLQKDWPGEKFEANKEAATRAALKLSADLGISRDKMLDGLQESLGLRDAMRLLHHMGNTMKLTGDTFEGGEHENGGFQATMGVEEARKAKTDLLADREFYNKYKKGDPEAKKRLEGLNAIIATEQPQTAKISTGAAGKK